jgi:hypothetical protein
MIAWTFPLAQTSLCFVLICVIQIHADLAGAARVLTPAPYERNSTPGTAATSRGQKDLRQIG